MFWSASELARLAGTGVAERARDDAALAAEDFHAHVPPLCAAHPGRLPARRMTLEAFRAAASWVASRAFGVDSYHGARSSLGCVGFSSGIQLRYVCADMPRLRTCTPRVES